MPSWRAGRTAAVKAEPPDTSGGEHRKVGSQEGNSACFGEWNPGE